MKGFPRTAIIGLSTILFGIAHAEQAATPQDYFALLPGYVFPSRSLGTTGHGFGVSALYGRPLRGPWAIEANIAGTMLETGDDGGTDFYRQGITADLVFNFPAGRGERLTAFALAGLGAAYDDFYPDERDGTALLIEAGVGVVSKRLFNQRVSLRAEARYVHDNREGGHGEPRLSLGIEIPLGRPEPAVVYVPVEKIVEREVVREVERQWIDTDGDGVENGRDQCPDTPRGLRVDGMGCAIVNQAIELRGVTFDFNQARLTTNAQTVLDGVSRAFTGQPALRVEIAGYTDSIGSNEANLRLSQQRAEAVRRYLIQKGAAETQLSARGYGETQLLIDPEKSDLDRERNRRVELRVVEGR